MVLIEVLYVRNHIFNFHRTFAIFRLTGSLVQLPGQLIGEGLTKESAEAIGLKEGTAVATSLIDAHAGGVGKH